MDYGIIQQLQILGFILTCKWKSAQSSSRSLLEVLLDHGDELVVQFRVVLLVACPEHQLVAPDTCADPVGRKQEFEEENLTMKKKI